MKKILFLKNINNYEPEIFALTRPLFERYVSKIGAELIIIQERAFPQLPISCETFQIYHLAKQHPADWYMYMDADVALHPNFLDFTEHVPKDTIISWRAEVTTLKYKSDAYFRRDGRYIGVGGFFTAASDWCLDFWHPLEDLTVEEAYANMTLHQVEIKAGQGKDHFLEEYILARNISRYKLKHIPMTQILARLGLENSNMCWHTCNTTGQDKLVRLRKILEAWEV